MGKICLQSFAVFSRHIMLMKDIRIKYIYNLDDIKDEWLQLEKQAVLYYFQSFLWLSQWYYNIGKNRRSYPLIVAVYNNQTIIALFPFCIERHYGIFRVLTWMGGKLADYNAPVFSNLLSEDERENICVMVTKELCRLKHIDVLLFLKIPEHLDDGAINPMNHTGIIALCTHPEDYLYAPYIILKDWESVYMRVNARRRSVSSKFRRRLTDMGTIKFRIAETLHEVEETTKVMISQKAECLSGKVKVNSFKNNDYINFYVNTGIKAFEEGYLHLSRLKLNDQTIATHWGILFNNRLYWLSPSFDGNYRTNGPGRLLLEELIRKCCDANVKCFDFCLGDEPYKSHWTDNKMILYRYLKPLTLKGFLFDKIYREVRPLLKRINPI